MKKLLILGCAMAMAFALNADSLKVLPPGSIFSGFSDDDACGNWSKPGMQFYYEEQNPDMYLERGVYSLGYGGSDMWGWGEGYTFVYLISSYSSFSMQIDCEKYNDPESAQCGIMIRTSPERGAKSLCFNYRKLSGKRFWNVNGRTTFTELYDQWDGPIGNVIEHDTEDDPKTIWGTTNFCQMKVARDGNVFTFYCRNNKDDEWMVFDEYTDTYEDFGETVYVGPYAASGAGENWSTIYNIIYEHTSEEFVAPDRVEVPKDAADAVISWSAAEGAISYDLERKLGEDGEWMTVADDITELTFADTTAPRDGTKIYYRVKAVNQKGEEATSVVYETRYFDYADGTGLWAYYYDIAVDPTVVDNFIASQIVTSCTFDAGYGEVYPGYSDNVRVVMSGKLVCPYSDSYTFTYWADDDIVILIDGVNIATSASGSATKYLDAGEHDIFISYTEFGSAASFTIRWGGCMAEGPIPTSQLKPVTTDLLPKGWIGWRNLSYSRGCLRYDAANDVYVFTCGSYDFWAEREAFTMLWRKVQKDNFDMSFKMENLSTSHNFKGGAMVRADIAAGSKCYSFNHRWSDDGQFYFFDINGRYGDDTSIRDHKSCLDDLLCLYGDTAVEHPETVWMKVSRRTNTYCFYYHLDGEVEWKLLDTVVDSDNELGKNPIVGPAMYGDGNTGNLQPFRYSHLVYEEYSAGMVILIR